MRRCTGLCGRTLPPTEFYGRNRKCKQCYNRQYAVAANRRGDIAMATSDTLIITLAVTPAQRQEAEAHLRGTTLLDTFRQAVEAAEAARRLLRGGAGVTQSKAYSRSDET